MISYDGSKAYPTRREPGRTAGGVRASRRTADHVLPLQRAEAAGPDNAGSDIAGSNTERGTVEPMDKGQPWSVKGIDPETRQAAKMAARRAGLTVGAWLNGVIQRAAAEELGGGSPRPAMQGNPQGNFQVNPQGNLQGNFQGNIQGMPPGYAPAPAYGLDPAQAAAHTHAVAHGQGPAMGQGPVMQGHPIQGAAGGLTETAAAGQPLQAHALDTLLDALRRQTEEVKSVIRSSTEELRYNTEKIQPMAERLRPMSERLEAIADRLEHVDEVDKRLDDAERKAERAALQVTPLERTLTRLFERLDNDDQMPYPGTDLRYRRRGLFGRLFGD